MSHGVRGDFNDFRGRSLIRDRGNWRTTVYQTGALPYFETSAAFCRDFDAFLAGAALPRDAVAVAQPDRGGLHPDSPRAA
jgi:hypothetical protein